MSTKSKMLSILESRKGSYVSGQELAKSLNISRTAVWKAVKGLREEGYEIQAVTNRGYALNEDSDILSEEAIRPWLERKEAEVQVWKEITSTNEKLKQMALEKKLVHGFLLAARQQTQGKGRKGRSFFSPGESGIYLSILLYPEKTVHESMEITAAAAVSVCRAVERCCGVSLGIKWVNDLYLGEKKVCGILTEAVTDFETGDIEFAVVGIGLNLYEPEGGFPEGLREQAGCLLKKEEKTDRNRLVGEIVNELLKEVEKREISREYISRNIVPGKKILVAYAGKERRVEALKIMKDGRLLVLNETGEQEVLPCGDVSLSFL